MPDPQVSVVKFHRQHDLPWNDQPPGVLKKMPGVETLGYCRGSNLAVGQLVLVYSRNGKKVWSGSITDCVPDNYSRAEGDAYFFSVVNLKDTSDPDQGEETIAVTVTNPTVASGSSTTASPQPTIQ